MMRRIPMGVVGLTVVACASAPAPEVGRAPVVVPSTPANAAVLPPPPRAELASPCGAVPKPPALLAAPPAAAATDTTCDHPKPVERQVTADIGMRYALSQKGSHLDVGFGCDGLREPIERITVAEGAGHGFNLNLYTFTRDGDRFLIRGQRYHEYRFLSPKPPLEMVEGEVSAREVEEILLTVRAALSATLTEVVPPPKPGTLSLGSISTSSHDFHIAVGLHTAKHRRRWRFSGYEGGDDQNIYIPLQVAWEALRRVLDELPSQDREPDGRDRAVFTDHFLQEHPHFGRDFNWWVKERYVAMAQSLGTRTLIAPLVGLLREGDDRSTTDTTDDALKALEAITGWDGGAGEGKAAPTRDGKISAYRNACLPKGK